MTIFTALFSDYLPDDCGYVVFFRKAGFIKRIINRIINRRGVHIMSLQETPDREKALNLLKKYNQNESLIRHAYAVESVMRHFAGLKNEDAEKWGIIGLIHDLDYEKYPDQHCTKSREILEEEKWPAEYIHAVVSHGWGICSDVEPESWMEKVLYTIDELTGLVATTAMVRPSKSVLDTTAKSVMKKWKDKRFAAGVDRSIIENGAKMIGMELEEVITQTIEGMKKAADATGLRGNIQV